MRSSSFLILSLCALSFVSVPQSSFAQTSTSVSVNFDFDSVPPVNAAPPALPVYVVPAPPDDGLVWLPGYWSWDGYDFFWVPGTWVQPPVVGYLWTPGYWAWEENAYYWHEGYWGRHVGYYGGIEYGGGYDGVGFNGGTWSGNHYIVNRIVVNVVNVHPNHPHPSFHGGQGGTAIDPTAEQARYMNEHHIHPARAQIDHAQLARRDASLRMSSNHGTPPVAATAAPGDLTRNIVPAQAEAPHAEHQPQPQTTVPTKPAQKQQHKVNRPQPRIEHQKPIAAPQPVVPSASQQEQAPVQHQSVEPEHQQHQEQRQEQHQQPQPLSQSNLHVAPSHEAQPHDEHRNDDHPHEEGRTHDEQR